MYDTLSQIRESGILELYVLNELSPSDRLLVEKLMIKFPDVKSDLKEIESSLEIYAKSVGVPAPKQILDSILNEVSNSSYSDKKENTVKRSGNARILILTGLLTASIFTAGYQYFKSKDIEFQIQKTIEDCDSEKEMLNQRILRLTNLKDFNNQVINIAATEKYPNTSIKIYVNTENSKNYIQVSELPSLAANESFQLWSLKPDTDPIPLDVFEAAGDENILEVQFVENTSAYAITIEPKGGSLSPNLDNLIGVFSIEG